MTAEESLQNGDLEAALQQLQQHIKQQPANAELRIFLFQLLAVLGQWDRALTQLNVAAELDDAALAMTAMYRQVIACERVREQVFLGTNSPIVFGQPQEWIALLLQALKLTAQEEYAKSQDLRNQAFDQATANTGTIDDQPSSWLADSDARLGPVIEAMIDGRYLWVPLDQLSSLQIDPPNDLRDVIWLPTHFTWHNGGESYGLLPARYPFSYRDDPLLALSRKTQWHDCGHDLFIGLGQKIWVTDVNEYPLLDTRSINLMAAAPSPSGA